MDGLDIENGVFPKVTKLVNAEKVIQIQPELF